MAAPEHHLEVRTRLPARATRKPPLLFIHGGYCDAWCWEPYFLPWFAARGYPAHALSLRGHGASDGKPDPFDVLGIPPESANAIVGLPRNLMQRTTHADGTTTTKFSADPEALIREYAIRGPDDVQLMVMGRVGHGGAG